MHTITLNNRSIPYTVTYSANRRRTIGLRIQGANGVLVMAPMGTSMTTIKTILVKKSSWIIKGFEDRGKAQAANDTTLWYLGRVYPLKILVGEPPYGVLLNGDAVTVHLKENLDQPSASMRIRRYIHEWYKIKAMAYIPKRLEALAIQHGLPYQNLIITNTKSQWGSCDSHNTIRISWRVMAADVASIDYVLIHELTHTVHKNHSPAFWQVVAHIMPDYQAHRHQLKIVGRVLTV
jgi:predicted metal-dependent hydrolase